MKTKTYDVIVIGVGGMGSATVYHLAKRGVRVLGLEQFDIPHELGSSHGITRIIRLAYAEHPDYVPLLFRAYELWRQLELEAGERLLYVTGGIDAGTRDSAVVQGSLRACVRHRLRHETLDARELTKRFPGYRLPDGMVGVYQPDAGFLLPERCIVAHVAGAQQLGADIRAREAVVQWEAAKSALKVTTDRGTYHAPRVVITAGAWARALVPLLGAAAVPERQVLLWTQPTRPAWFTPGAFPIFNLDAREGRFYGFPVHAVPGFKIGKYHHRGEQVEPDTIDRTCTLEDERVLRAGIRAYFPHANGPTMAMKTCMFTNSPDEHFILDLHPEWPQVAIAAGFSGHGFKFCSVVGEIMSDLALEGRTQHPTRMFRLDRPAIRSVARP